MAPPTNRKRAPSSATRPPSSATTKRQATNRASGTTSKTHKGRKAAPPSSSLLTTAGFSSSKRPTYNTGTKILLDDSIYDTRVPAEVEGCYFVYQVVAHLDDNHVRIQYKKQVIDEEGDQFRVYEDTEEEHLVVALEQEIYANENGVDIDLQERNEPNEPIEPIEVDSDSSTDSESPSK